MRIVSWNCNNKFREKYKEVLALKADVYVIDECEDPAQCEDVHYRELMRNGYWVGDLPYKGLAVFSTSPDIRLEKLDWPGRDKKLFLPVRINDAVTLLGVWTFKPYCEVFSDYLTDIEMMLDEPSLIMMGDFNSNVMFDKMHRKRKTWGACLERLSPRGFVDAYHFKKKEEQGRESTPTFFLYRHLDRPYHLDHCLTRPENIKDFKVDTLYKWLNLSDHLPIILDIEDPLGPP